MEEWCGFTNEWDLIQPMGLVNPADVLVVDKGRNLSAADNSDNSDLLN